MSTLCLSCIHKNKLDWTCDCHAPAMALSSKYFAPLQYNFIFYTLPMGRGTAVDFLSVPVLSFKLQGHIYSIISTLHSRMCLARFNNDHNFARRINWTYQILHLITRLRSRAKQKIARSVSWAREHTSTSNKVTLLNKYGQGRLGSSPAWVRNYEHSWARM